MSQSHTPLPPNGTDYDRWFAAIKTLVMHHSPSGVETEIDHWLLAEFAALGLEVWQDEAGNVIAKIAGKQADRVIAITAHKDEIGAIVKQVEDDGRVIYVNWAVRFPGCMAKVRSTCSVTTAR